MIIPPCSSQWVPQPSGNIEFTFTYPHVVQQPNELEFLFGCINCADWWKPTLGDQVNLNIETQWVSVPGTAVNIDFVCEDEGGETGYTFFTGYFEASTGSTFSLDFTETFSPRFYTGEHLGGIDCDVLLAPTLQTTHTVGMQTTVSSNNGTAQEATSNGYSGANFRLDDTLDVSGTTTITWRNSLTPQAWYDNDNTDAVVRFEVYLTDSYDILTRFPGQWSYSSMLSSPTGVISWWVQFGAGSDGRVTYRNAAGVSTTLFTPTVPPEFNLVDGSKQLSLVIQPVDEFSVEVQAYADDVLLGSGIAVGGRTPKVAPIWHYHNYANRTPVYSLENVQTSGCTEFLTTYPMAGFGNINFREGQTTETVLSTTYSFPLTAQTGEWATAYLATDSNLDVVEFRAGEYTFLNLTDNPPWLIVASSFTGESISPFVLNVSQTFDFNFYVGEVSSLVLETSPGQSFGNILAYTGDAVAVELAPAYALEPRFFTGETLAEVQLGTDVYLDDFLVFTGETVEYDLTQNLPWEFIAFARAGESASFTLATTSLIRPLFYAGEAAQFDFTLPPVPAILLQSYEGQTASFVLSTAANLGDILPHTGESASLDLGTEPFWRMHTGETVLANIATTTTLPAAAYTGETFAVELSVRASEGMGLFRAYAGETSQILVTIRKQVLLYPNTISTRPQFNVEFDISTSFDLLNTACCPVKESHERIELSHQEAPDETYDGDKTVAVVDLSTLPRFQLDFFDGAHARGIDPNYLGKIDFYDGHVITPDTLHYAYTDFRLCYGNFIPDGDNTIIELVSIYDDNCESDYMFAGETAFVLLENNVGAEAPMFAGERMFIDLEVIQPMLLRAYTGEYARVSNPEFVVNMFDGDTLLFVFHETAWEAYTGELVEVNLVTEYDVEFLERGCLDNEFIPINENGDPDLEKFNPVPIELEFYRHEIKARCF